MQLRPYQQQLNHDIHQSWASGNRNVLAVMPTGAGKCLGKGTPILMYDGIIKPVEDVVVGDTLMGPNNKARNILSVCQGREMLYEITPIKGDPYTVNESHILSLKKTGSHEIVNLSIREYLRSSKSFKHLHKGWRTGVNFNESVSDHAIPPYILGIWLGDGNHTHNINCITTPDIEIKKAWSEYCDTLGDDYKLSKQDSKGTRCPTYRIMYKNKGRGYHNEVKSRLEYMGYGNGKLFIPYTYKTANRKDRIQILSGLLDTDGYLSKNTYEITSKSKRLADDILFVARSLGLAAYCKDSWNKCQSFEEKRLYHRIIISGDIDILKLRIPRKQGDLRKQIKSVLVTGIKVKSIGIGDYYGFEIDGDHLFMLGDFTVTHNTVCFTGVLDEHQGVSCAIAHRQELVSQMSLTLAKRGMKHNIIAPDKVIRNICRLHTDELGKCFFHYDAPCFVAGVDTLVRRTDKLRNLCNQVTLWIIDECAHVLHDNKWGKAVDLFPYARGLGVTATPLRADGNGLGSHADGVFDTMIEGPTMRELIDQNYLTDYRIFAPSAGIDLNKVKITKSGDYNAKQLKFETRQTQIVGDIVQHYMRITPGKLGITFVTDVETAGDVATQFNQAGIPAIALSAKTPDTERFNAIRKFKNREIMQLVNVDLFTEGFDLPAIEVVSMARATQSYSWFVQAFGRALRPMEGKSHATIIDHVGNCLSHGLPDAPRLWTLDRRERRKKSADPDIPKVKCCTSCTGIYEAYFVKCPYCGFKPVPISRQAPEHVDGDLTELDPVILAKMRGEIEQVDMSDRVVRDNMLRSGASDVVANSVAKNHRLRQEAQQLLRDKIRSWGESRRMEGMSDVESYRLFYITFGIDVMSAQLLNRAGAEELFNKLIDSTDRMP